VRIATFVRARVWDPATKRLQRRVAGGVAGIDGFAEDYACLAWGLIELFQATGDAEWLAWALDLHASLDALFRAPEDRGWFATTGEDPSVLVRQVEEYDGAEPSATSVAVANLLALSRLTGRADLQASAERVLAARRGQLASQPRVAPHLLAALSTTLQPAIEVVVTGGNGARALHHTMTSRFLPSAVVVPLSVATAAPLAELTPWLRPYADRAGDVAAFVCRQFVCARPVTEPEPLAVLLDGIMRPDTIDDAGTVQ
jgi:uncharacterized protein